MIFQIKELILWPRNSAFEPRRVPFGIGSITVISGASRTGKSAVIPIIDYCLASGSCSIPVKTIRENCEWFGIVVKTSNGEKLLARREPGAQKSTDDMFLLEAPEIVDVPTRVTKNTNAGNIRHLLDELSGLSNLDFGAGESQSGFDARIGFRDLMAFVFQPQNVVANPDVLFFKTDRYDHREKLKNIFPYVLGAITPAVLAKEHELSLLNSELNRKERELKKAEHVSAQWVAELQTRVSEARELGLITTVPNSVLSRERMLQLLEELVLSTDATLKVSTETINDAVQELNELDNEESKVSSVLTSLRRRLNEMTRIRESASNYHEALHIQRDRLQLADWLGQHRIGDDSCPVCGGGMQPSKEKLEELKEALTKIEDESGDSFEIPAAFDREMQRVQADVNDTTEKLKAIQIRKKALSQRSEAANALQYQAKKVERFIGNIENSLHLHRRLGEDDGLREELEQLKERRQRLKDELLHEDVAARKRRALQKINTYAAKLMPYLDNDRPNDPISLEIKELTIKVAGSNREDYLSEIGSGSNWLSYHLAIMLALQEHFMAQKHSPVPGFLIVDQPSQVYFPKKLVVRETDAPLEPQFKDEDIEAVQKAFKVMAKVVESANGRLQVIVLDHAAREVWEGIPNVVAIEEWRDGLKLVPTKWIS